MNNRWRRVKRLEKAEFGVMSSSERLYCQTRRAILIMAESADESHLSPHTFDKLGEALVRAQAKAEKNHVEEGTFACQMHRLNEDLKNFMLTAITKYFKWGGRS